MIPKISLTAAFLLMVAPSLACASNRDATNPAPIIRQAHESPLSMVVAQENQPNVGTSDNDNDNANNSNDSADDNQNDQQNAAGNDQPIPPQVLNGSDHDPNDTPAETQMNVYPQPVNPYQ